MNFLRVFLTAAACSSTVLADEVSSNDWDGLFARGNYELTTGAAAYWSPFVATKNRPTENYAVGAVSVGYMIEEVKERGVLRGNFEVLGEAFGGGVFEGEGNYVAGCTLWGRYNFVQPGWRLVPYFQLGGGGTVSDMDRYLTGQAFNFNLGASVGSRLFLTEAVALTSEYRFQHLSNANMADKNVGINAQGFFVGVSWFF